MKCNEIQDLIVDYFDKNIEDKMRADIDKHLEECQACRQEYDEYAHTAAAIKSTVRARQQGITAGSNFENLMYSALANEKRAKTGIFTGRKKIVSIAAAIAVMVTVTIFTPAFGAIRAGISNLLDFALGDSGIVNSVENGFGQAIEKSAHDNGVSFTLHSFISDANRSVALVSTRCGAISGEKTDNLTMYGLKIGDQSGNSVTNGYTTHFKYDPAKHELTGNIDLGQITSSAKSLAIGFDTVVLSKQEKLSIPVDLTGKTLRGIGLAMNLNTPTVKELTLNDIVFNGNNLSIEYGVRYTDRKYMTGGQSLELITGDGSAYYKNTGHSCTADYQTNTENFTDTFDIEDLDITKCKLEYAFAKPVSVIEGNWKVSFNPERDIAETSTMTLTPDKSFDIGSHRMKVVKMSFTPSMTSVQIECNDVSPLNLLGPMSLKTRDGSVFNSTGGVNTAIVSSSSGGPYSAVYNFDPVYRPEDITLVIDSARFEINADYRKLQCEIKLI